MTRDDFILPLPEPLGQLSHVRSTLLLAAIGGLQEAGHYDAYVAHASERVRRSVVEGVAGTWIDVRTAIEHYEACDALGLPHAEQVALGGRTFERIKGTLLGTAVRLAQSAGVTPWTVLAQVGRYWSRGYEGSAIGVARLGLKDARVDVAGMPLVTSAYYRNALRGLCMGVVGLVCTRCFMRELPAGATSSRRSFSLQWA